MINIKNIKIMIILLLLVLPLLSLSQCSSKCKCYPIPIKYNIFDGRDPNATGWCKVIIVPSHLGLSMWDIPPSWWGNYTLYTTPGYKAAAIQITAAVNETKTFVPALMKNATAYFDEILSFQWVDFTIAWATRSLELYVGMINMTKLDPNVPDLDNYCSVWRIKYGECATDPTIENGCYSGN